MYLIFIILWGLKAHLVLGYHPKLVAYARFNLKGRITEGLLKAFWSTSLNSLIANVSYSLVMIVSGNETGIFSGVLFFYQVTIVLFLSPFHDMFSKKTVKEKTTRWSVFFVSSTLGAFCIYIGSH